MKLYILGALALSGVSAGTLGSVTSATLGATATTINAATYTYTLTGDCFSAGTATTLGLNNIYYQYYTFTLAAGTLTYASSAPVFALGGCSHSHVYNFMAQPYVTSVAGTTDGMLDAISAYGYKMTGTAVTSCAAATQVTTTLYTSATKVYIGAKYQSVGAILTAAGGTAGTIPTPIYTAIGKTSSDNVLLVAATVSTLSATVDGIVLTSSNTAYWDFMQTNVFQGQTVFGRGGGAATGPCGWWVVYSYEAPGIGSVATADVVGVSYYAYPTNTGATVAMWTDNSIATTLGAFVLAGLSAILY